MKGRASFVFAAAVAAAGAASAQVRPAYVFSDGMVLQAHAKVPVWGMADPGEPVEASFAGAKVSTVADADGRWRVDLPPMEYSAKGSKLVLRGSTIVEFDDVLVGEVWLGAGQSNMEYPLRLTEGGKALLKSRDIPDTVRYLHVPKDGSATPRGMFDIPRDARWRTYDAANERFTKEMSYLLTLFGKRLSDELHVPVGLVSIAAGGANLESWMSAEAIREAGTEKEAERLLKTTEGWRANDIRRWRERPEKEKGRLFPKINFESRPTQCWNALAEPVLPYRVRGVLWYQGEMNSGWKMYLKQFPAFAGRFRAAFEIPDAPFYIVQLPDSRGDNWPFIRNVQRLMSERIGHSGLAVTIDGNDLELHPRDKTVLADRLARLALADCYGKKIIARSPYPAEVRRAGKKIEVAFKYADGGLKTADGRPPRTFEVAGEDGRFVPAPASVAGGGKVAVDVPKEISAPKTLRYGWAADPDVNLVNAGGLPATPFEESIR